MHRAAGNSQVGRSAGTAAAAHNPLLPNPSACFQKAQTALQPSRQPAAAAGLVNAQQGHVHSSQGPVNAVKPRAAGQPLAAQDKEDDPLVLQLVEIANCSYAKAKKVTNHVLELGLCSPAVVAAAPLSAWGT